MTSSEHMTCLFDCDLCNNTSLTCMDECCHGFRAGKLLQDSCLCCVNC